MNLQTHRVTKRFGDDTIIKDISLEIRCSLFNSVRGDLLELGDGIVVR